MDKENYNIDDILSEVKKRREENETKIIGAGEQKSTAKPTDKNKAKDKPIFTVSEKPAEQKSAEAQQPKNAGRSAAEKAAASRKAEDGTPKKAAAPAPAAKKAKNKAQPEIAAKPADNGMVDLIQMSSTAAEKEIEKADGGAATKKTSGKKKNKTLKTVVVVLVILIVAAAVFGVVYANNALNSISNGSSNDSNIEEQWTGMDKLEETFNPITETEASDLSSLQDMIKTWYYNGDPVKSTHVLNVLLIGEDTRGDEILDDDTRADSAIIASINVDTKQITLTSILRDTYAYWENTPGDESTGTFGKINGAMSLGSVNAYINCVEKLYKVDIDNYVIVNFDSFESIVDTLGGVTLELTDKEINEINNHQKRYGNVTIDKTFEGTSGKMKLNGKQALAYCRIRKLDSDNMRANRQKTCLTEIFNESKDVSTSKMIKIVNSLIPYVKTGFNKSSVIKIAKYALSEGWMDYDINMTTIPDSRINEKGAGGTYYGAWCWKADFPQDAYNIQLRLYGKSSITLAKSRVDVLKCAEKGFRSEGASPVYATITNNAYGEASTLKDETTTTTTL